MLGFEEDFSCHFHLGQIRIPRFWPFPSAPLPLNDKEDGFYVEVELLFLRSP